MQNQSQMQNQMQKQTKGEEVYSANSWMPHLVYSYLSVAWHFARPEHELRGQLSLIL